MRDLKECTAEVFRRSEERLKKQKRARLRIVAVCVPLLVIASLAAAMLPPGTPAKRAHDEADHFVAESAGSYECAFTALEIQKPEQNKRVTDRPEVAKAYFAVCSFFEETAFADEYRGENYDVPGKPENIGENELASTADEYTLTFITDEGVQNVYTLNGNTLQNERSGQRVILSDAQLAGLMEALDIAE